MDVFFWNAVVPGGSIQETVDKIDPENLEVQYTQFGGGPFGKKLENAVHTVKLVPLPDGGCIFKTTMVVKPLPGMEQFVDEELELLKELDVGEFKALEAYLLANPSVCAWSTICGGSMVLCCVMLSV